MGPVPVAAFFAAMMVVWALLLAKELSRGRLGLIPILASFVFFQFWNCITENAILHTKLFNRIPRQSVNVFINTSVSLLHSLLISVSVVSCLVLEFTSSGSFVKMMQFESLYSRAWPGAYALLGFSCGYFAYDQVDMLRRLRHESGTLSLLAHHWILLNCFTLALFRQVSINYLVLTLLCEVHSVFLHWRRVGRMAGLRTLGSSSLTIEWVLNWMAYFLTRMLVHLGISFKLVQDASKFPSKSELFLAVTGMSGLNILNVYLGLDLKRACLKELRPKKKADT